MSTNQKQMNVVINSIDNGVLVTNLGKTRHYNSTEDFLTSVINTDNLLHGSLPGNEKDSNNGIIEGVLKDFVNKTYTLSIIADEEVQVEETPEVKRVANIKSMLKDILERDKKDEAPVALTPLRISVDENNAYSVARLKNIPFEKYLKEGNYIGREVTMIIYGNLDKLPTINQTLVRVRAGRETFGSSLTRVRMTILAKYFEAKTGQKWTSAERLKSSKAKMDEALAELQLLADRGDNMLKGKKLIDVIIKFREAKSMLPELEVSELK